MPTIFPGSKEASCSEIDKLAGKIEAFLNGEEISFTLDLAQMDACPRFQQSVLRAEHQVPHGSVATYRSVAEYLLRPKAARAVGNALAKNPFPIIVPCHRAIRSDGSLGGYQGGAPMKRALLEAEGVQLDDRDRVLESRFYHAFPSYSERGTYEGRVQG